MSKSLRALGAALWLAGAAAGPARAQQLLDWTIHTRAEPEALATGADAVFWNPAGLGVLAGRGEALAAALQTSDQVGLKGLAAAGVVRLARGTSMAVGYEHFGIDDIGRTGTEPPDTGAADLFAVGEDRLTLGAAQPIGRRAWVGGLVEYDRADSGMGVTDGFTFGAGALLTGGGPLAPQLGVAALALSGSTRWRAGLGAALPFSARLPATVRVSYGIAGQSDRPGRPAQRLAVTGDFHDRLTLSLAGVAERSDGETAYTPEAMAEFRVGRYVLGVVRESLANDFGPALAFHLGARF